MAVNRLINETQGNDIIDRLNDIADNIQNIQYGLETSSDNVVAMTGYQKASTAGSIGETDTLNEAIGKLEKRVDLTEDTADKADNISAGDGIDITGDGSTGNAKTITNTGVFSVENTTNADTTAVNGDIRVVKKTVSNGVTSEVVSYVKPKGISAAAFKSIDNSTSGLSNDDDYVPTSKAVIEAIDEALASASIYQGTIAAFNDLPTSTATVIVQKGWYYRVSTAWAAATGTPAAHVGDIIIAEKQSPSKSIDGTNWSLLHNEMNTDANVAQSPVSTNADYEVLFSGSADNTAHTEGTGKDTGIKFNPSTDKLTVAGQVEANSFSGSGALLTNTLTTVKASTDGGSTYTDIAPKTGESAIKLKSSKGIEIAVDTTNKEIEIKHSHTDITAQQTAAFKKVAYDAQGHITGVADVTGTDLPSHNHTKSQITDFPTSMTPTSHTHGNIQNAGTLQTNDITIASGDKLVVTDSSDSSKIARTSISFDGSTTTKALTQKGTWETFNNYSHPTHTEKASGLYKITVDSLGHVSAATTATGTDLPSHNHTKSQITDFPTSMTPTSHTHGNIQNGGTLQTNDITIASGDKLIVTDSSNSSKIARTSISFDGSTTTKALTKKGTWETFNNYTHPTTSGNKHIPSGGSSGQILKWSADGTAAWGSVPCGTMDASAVITCSKYFSIRYGKLFYQGKHVFGSILMSCINSSYIVGKIDTTTAFIGSVSRQNCDSDIWEGMYYEVESGQINLCDPIKGGDLIVLHLNYLMNY